MSSLRLTSSVERRIFFEQVRSTVAAELREGDQPLTENTKFAAEFTFRCV